MKFSVLLIFVIKWGLAVGQGWASDGTTQSQWVDNNYIFRNSTFICNIDIWEGEQEEFLSKYAFTWPVILRKGSDNQYFREQCTKSNLLANYGDLTVRLSSANSYSYDKVDVQFKNYVNHMLQPEINKLGNETFYFFGDVLPEQFDEVLRHYNPPPLQLPNTKPAISFGIAGTGTGVPFHFHGPGFSETIHGRKHWFLYPPTLTPAFHPNESSLQWLLNSDIYTDSNLLQCTVNEGQVIYFPNQWWHSTLNLEPSVFVSTFLGPP